MKLLHSHKNFLDFKMDVKSRKIVLDRIRIFLGLKLARGELALKMILKRIQLSKEIFIFEIEQGNEAFITKDISQDIYPNSFRYYDFILNFVREKISFNRREVYGIKKAISLTF